MITSLTIRPETSADWPAVAEIITSAFTAAFGESAEAELVQRIRKAGLIEIALVAEQDGAIGGHIVFSRLDVTGDGRTLNALALAPVSVTPALQRSGIGGRLIEAGHAVARERGFDAVFLLGHPTYYPRFGYSAAGAAPFRAPFGGDHFMALALKPGTLDVASGTVAYPPPWGL
ncbi:MAG: N-acetyltransferase [Alphaproteobacteria bacterium]|nr:N-acetyltransferase [Alphaproteobacteria bacterium]